MRATVYVILCSALPAVLTAWDAFDDTSCLTRVKECMVKWLPVVADNRKPEGEDSFCNCWNGLSAGDCKDTAQTNHVGVQHYDEAACAAGILSSHVGVVIFSLFLTILLGIQRGNT